MNAPLRLLPAPSLAPMGTGPVAFGDDAPGVFVRGDQAAFMSGLLTGAVSGVLDGAPDRAALSLCVHALRAAEIRSEEHTSELQSLMRISYAVFCLKKKTINRNILH